MRLSSRFAEWNRGCRNALRRSVLNSTKDTDLLAQLRKKKAFEIKDGVLASDDLVLTFVDRKEQAAFFSKCQDDAKAYDMESAGFAHACFNRLADSIPNWTSVRGISDHGVIANRKKYHDVAAGVAAYWVKLFLSEGLGPLHPAAQSSKGAGDGKTKLLEHYDWLRLFRRLRRAQRENRIVGKGIFMNRYLASDKNDLRALRYAILKKGIGEHDIPNPAENASNHTTTLTLNKGAEFWDDKISAKDRGCVPRFTSRLGQILRPHPAA